MAHRKTQSRTPRTLHHLQDDRLFSLSGGIPPEHFDNLNFVSTRRGRRLVAPAPTGDPWGYYAECRESRCMEADRTVLEASTQPRTESSTEAMDTDEGQRTTPVSPAAPIFNLNRANVQVASSVSSFDEGEGIINDNDF